MEERRVRIAVAEEGVDQFQIADGHLIELQAVGSLVEADAVDVVELGLLGVAGVMQHGSGGNRGGRMSGEAEAVERPCA